MRKCSVCRNIREFHTSKEMYECIMIRLNKRDKRGYSLQDRMELK